VTPRDEEMRPSGTLQSPTTGSLAEMMKETEREEQIAAARALPRNAVIQLPDAPLEVVKATDATLMKPSQAVNNTTATATTNPAPAPVPNNTAAAQNPVVTAQNNPAAVANMGPNTAAPAPNTAVTAANNNKPATTMEELPSFVPAPKSLVSEKAAADVAAVNPSAAGAQNAVLTSGAPKPAETSLDAKADARRVAQLSFLPAQDVMKIGEKRRYAIQLNSDVPLTLALLALRFDPKVVKVNALTAGSLIGSESDGAPLFTPSIDATGVCLISISSLSGKATFRGSGPLLFIDVEAIAPGNASLVFDKERLHLVASDARDVVSEVIQGTATVKQ